MHHFAYRDKELHCEDVALRDIADTVGTPFYVYSHATLTRHYQKFYDAFDGLDRLVCFSAKANASLAILSLLNSLGCGLDIVSGGELYRGLQAGIPPHKIVYSGVGKRVDEIDDALSTGILMFNVESLEELEVINQRAGQLRTRAPIAIRVNPDVDPKTHPYISTGLKKNKFGIDAESALQGYKIAQQMDHIDIIGIDCHIGSQITEVQPFRDALQNLKRLVQSLADLGIQISHLDMGGGLGITYNDEVPPQLSEYAQAIVEILQNQPLTLILEPGRVIVGNAGVLVTRVLYHKNTGAKHFMVVDAGMNDLLRPAIYQAYHGLMPVRQTGVETIVADVVGPICESSDFLAQERSIPDVANGELLAVMSAGAYGFVMASNYCSRLLVAEVMVKGDRFEVIRSRQAYSDLVAGESVPSFLA